MSQQKHFVIPLIIIIASFATGCNSNTNPGSSPESPPLEQEQPPLAEAPLNPNALPAPVAPDPSPTPEDELTPASPHVVYPTGWSAVVINANYAKTTVSVAAHFATNRNACGKDAYGAIDLDLWNNFAKYANQAIAQHSRADEFCVDPPTDTAHYMDGTVDMKIGPKTVTLFELKDGQICSSIQNKVVAANLLRAVNQIILVADKEDCPNGWGS